MAVMGYGTRMSVPSDIKDVFTISSCREIVMKFPVSCSVYVIIMQILKKKKNHGGYLTFSGIGVPVPDFTAHYVKLEVS